MVLVHGTGIIGIHGVWSYKYLTRFLKSTLKILVNPGDAKTHMFCCLFCTILLYVGTHILAESLRILTISQIIVRVYKVCDSIKPSDRTLHGAVIV